MHMSSINKAVAIAICVTLYSITVLSNQYTYVDCYRDNATDRALSYGPIQHIKTVDQCYTLCANSQYNKYFALQANTHCFCGNSLQNATRHGTATNCATDKTGGQEANDLFKVTKMIIFSKSYQYVGCYKDTINRALPYVLSNILNIDQCYSFCIDSQYKYFAMENSNQCFCGHSYKNATQYGNSTDCPQSKLGGIWAMDLFEVTGSIYSSTQYILVHSHTDSDKLDFDAAQDFCNAKYNTTLATVISHDDFNQVIGLRDQVIAITNKNISIEWIKIWIGLKKSHDSMGWLDGTSCDYAPHHNCSNDRHFTFNLPTDEDCVMIDHLLGNVDICWTYFMHWPCDANLDSFVCNSPTYDESIYAQYVINNTLPIPRRYILVNESKNREDAEQYCKDAFATNLATILNDGDYYEINQVRIERNSIDKHWIGLYRDSTK